MSKEVKIVFQPSGRIVHALPGTVILEAAALAGFIIHTPCGGTAKCAKCVILIRSGTCPATEQEISALGKVRTDEGARLACLARITGPITIEVPESSLFQAHQQILTGDSGETREVKPRVSKKVFKIPPPPLTKPALTLNAFRRPASLRH